MSLNDGNSSSHTKWNCIYQIVFAPKYRSYEGKVEPDDIPEIRKYEICIPEPGVLVQRVLCGYRRKKHGGDPGVHSKATENRQKNRPAEPG